MSRCAKEFVGEFHGFCATSRDPTQAPSLQRSREHNHASPKPEHVPRKFSKFAEQPMNEKATFRACPVCFLIL